MKGNGRRGKEGLIQGKNKLSGFGKENRSVLSLEKRSLSYGEEVFRISGGLTR